MPRLVLPQADGNAPSDVVHFAARILHADDQHVLGEPAFGARLEARDAQRMALLAEQRIAAVARADALDREFLGEMHDEALVGIEVADRVQALDEGAVLLDAVQRRRAHAGHDAHVEHDVRAVGDLDAAARVGRVDRAHAVGHDVHRAALHAAGEQRVDGLVTCGGIHPVVVRARVFLLRRADEGEVLDARDIRRIRAVQVAVGKRRLVEFDQVAGAEHQLDQFVALDVRAVAPVDAVGLRQFRGLLDPIAQGCIRSH